MQLTQARKASNVKSSKNKKREKATETRADQDPTQDQNQRGTDTDLHSLALTTELTYARREYNSASGPHNSTQRAPHLFLFLKNRRAPAAVIL
jgi:hypothetical protein